MDAEHPPAAAFPEGRQTEQMRTIGNRTSRLGPITLGSPSVPFVSFYIPPGAGCSPYLSVPDSGFTAIPCKTFTNTRGWGMHFTKKYVVARCANLNRPYLVNVNARSSGISSRIRSIELSSCGEHSVNSTRSLRLDFFLSTIFFRPWKSNLSRTFGTSRIYIFGSLNFFSKFLQCSSS